MLPEQIKNIHKQAEKENQRKNMCINSHNKKREKKPYGVSERKQNTLPSDQMYSLRKISNHPNSQTSLQKLVGKSSVPCHITHIYQDAA